jgi:DNA-directed RNA polymerase subunit RPC12/RpoP
MIAWGTIAGLIITALDRAGFRPSEPGLVFLFMIVSLFAIPAILALIVRDKVLFRVLYDRIKTARCPQCQFSLLGLPVQEGTARCPECGMHIVLRQHNLTPEDLLVRRVGEEGLEAQAPERCAKCGLSLRGVSIAENAVRCPECGHTEALHKRNVMQSVHGGRIPHAFVDQHARITVCPTCNTSLIGLPVYEGQARCWECGFIASVEPRPEDHAPASESASEVGLRIKKRRAGSDEKRNTEQSEQAEGSGGNAK